MDNDILLSIENLRINFASRRGDIEAVRGVSFSMRREKIGIVGESGSGKSITGRSILGLLPPSAKMSVDRMMFKGEDLSSFNQKQRAAIRGQSISMILQDPKYSLNPVMRVDTQLEEACRINGLRKASEIKNRMIEMLNAVSITDPERVLKTYPHELSGGMAQRVMIAMMVLPKPDLLIADEPTSALDVTVQHQVLQIMDDLVTQNGMGLIFISHDLNLVASYCDRILIMYAGRIVEVCEANKLAEAKHPYTRGLLKCLPHMDGARNDLPTLQRDPSWMER